MTGGMRGTRRGKTAPFCPGLSQTFRAGVRVWLGMPGGCVFQEGPITMLCNDFLLGLLWPGHSGNGEQWDSGASQTERDPEATFPLPQGKEPPAVPLLTGGQDAPSMAGRPTILVSVGEGELLRVQEAKGGVSHGEGSFLPMGPCVAL